MLKILRRLNRGLYVTGLRGNEIKDDVLEFIYRCRRLFFGDIVDQVLSRGKLFQAKPMLHLIKANGELTFKSKIPLLQHDEVGDYLNIATLFLNNTCGRNCSICGYAYKQIFNCTSGGNHREELGLDEIDAFLEQAACSTSLYRVNLMGGNILQYSGWNKLPDVLKKYDVRFEYYINYRNIIQNTGEKIKTLDQVSGTLHVLINPPASAEHVEEVLVFLTRAKIKVVYQFLVEEESDYSLAMKIISKHRIENYEFAPVYNGRNETVFKENFFITKSAISKAKPSMKNIYSRMLLNVLFFKSIIIKSDKKVYASLFKSSIGDLGRDTLFEIIKNELERGTVWNRIRRHVKPCKSCPFNAICPPISNYEYALEKYNLCNIFEG